MTSRRTFLRASVASAAGLIVPSWVRCAEQYIQLEKAPYIEHLPTHESILNAVDWGQGEYQLFLGDPFAQPNLDATWEELIDTYYEAQDEFDARLDEAREYKDVDPPNLQNLVDNDLIYRLWGEEESPRQLAYDFLQAMDIGPELGEDNCVGEVSFYDGLHPGDDTQIVAVPDLLSLSLLQKRLNHIHGTIEVKVVDRGR